MSGLSPVEAKASRLPSGDHSGLVSNSSGVFVKFVKATIEYKKKLLEVTV